MRYTRFINSCTSAPKNSSKRLVLKFYAQPSPAALGGSQPAEEPSSGHLRRTAPESGALLRRRREEEGVVMGGGTICCEFEAKRRMPHWPSSHLPIDALMVWLLRGGEQAPLLRLREVRLPSLPASGNLLSRRRGRCTAAGGAASTATFLCRCQLCPTRIFRGRLESA